MVPRMTSVRSYFQAILIFLLLTPFSVKGQDAISTLVHKIDSSVRARDQGIAGYTVTEHYALFRGRNEDRQAADMVVKTTYRRDAGKSYSIVSESGTELLRKLLETILDNEKRMTQPANRATALITSANYEMAVKGTEPVEGRDCVAVILTPKRSSPYLFNGTIWVDSQDGSIVQLQGTSSKAPSVFTGPSQVFRQYAPINGFPMATHAKAISNSWALGRTTIKIDYTGYQLQAQSGQ